MGLRYIQSALIIFNFDAATTIVMTKIDINFNFISLLHLQVTLVSLGVPEIHNKLYRCKIGEKTILLQPGYEAIRMIGAANLHCRIEKGDEGPEFVVNCSNPPFSKRDRVCTDVVKAAFDAIDYKPKRRWSGVEFFGLCLQNQLSSLSYDAYLCHEKENLPVKATVNRDAAHPLAKKLMDNAHRNAGPTSLLNRPAQVARNQFISDLVDFSSFGDPTSEYSPKHASIESYLSL